MAKQTRRNRADNPYLFPQNPSGVPEADDNVFTSTRYAVKQLPDSSDVGYTMAYATPLHPGGSTDGVPSAIRIGTREPPPNNPNNHEYSRKRDTSRRLRRRDVNTTVGWDIKQARIPPPNVPAWNQTVLPSRPTANDSPSGYRFTRYWHIPRPIQRIFGTDAVAHFSLANHRRVTEIYGMAPRGNVGMNTYRVAPRPWDEDLVVANSSASASQESVFTENIAQRSGRVF